jgi:HEAT repeats
MAELVRRGSRTFWALFGVSLVLALLRPAPLLAEGRVAFLADRLRYPPSAGHPDDFRVRTNAALALGATNDDDAVPPLCGGLADPSEVVRQAVGVALRRLARASSADCLRRRLAVETNGAVKLQLQRALEAAQSSGGPAAGSPAPPQVAGAKYYVAVSPVTNGSTRATPDVERVVRDAITSKLGELGEYQLAPVGESQDAARATLHERNLKGYYLGVSVEKFDYSGGNLRVRVRITVFSYPGRELRGEVPAAATLPGTLPGDHAAEDQLLGVVAAHGAELFAQNFR